MSHPITKLAVLALTGALLAHAALDIEEARYGVHETRRLDTYYAQIEATPKSAPSPSLTPSPTATPSPTSAVVDSARFV